MDYTQLPELLSEVDWTFEDADTQYLTHGLHKYPARMIPQIPDGLLSALETAGFNSNQIVLDPFCGSGTSLVEANLHNHSAIGFDINPFACQLSRAKTTQIDDWDAVTTAVSQLESEYEKITEITTESEAFIEEEETDVNAGWFPQPQFSQLIALEKEIAQIENDYNMDVSRLFRIALSNIVRNVSFQRNGEFKRYRMPEEKRDEHTPDVIGLFQNSLQEVLDAVQEFSDEVNTEFNTEVHQSDSRVMNEIDKNEVDCVITSPPYGDHRTTVAYGQFSRDLSIIAHNETRDSMLDVDKTGLGGRYDYETTDSIQSYSPSLQRTVDALNDVEGRADDALNFFEDYFAVMKQVGRVVKEGGPVVWVVSNRTMSRQPIPTHLITRELCEHLGFTHIKTVPREIPTKTLPWENAPENEIGNKGALMADENIIVMTAPENVETE